MEFVEFIKTPMVDNVILRRFFKNAVEGTLCITGHHLIFSSRKDNKEELWMLHSSIDSMEKKLAGTGGTLSFRCKNFDILQLEFPLAEDCLNVASSVEHLSNIDTVVLKYPFFYRPQFEVLEDGWQAFQPETEFNRFQDCNEEWRLSYINKDYKICPTYPHAVVVPKSVDDETLLKAAAFRHLGRFPVLSYYHKDSKAAIMRSSQPLTGPNNRRCKEDERLVNAVLGIGRRGGFIVDTRSQSSSKIAQSKGGGYEVEAHYSQWKRINQPIEKQQSFHDSLIKFIEACSDGSANTDKWLSKLESSNWLTHIKDIITCACVVAQCIDKQSASVLVHGSDGMDTTLQVTSLAQIILDHDCRTVTGFEALIEREWLQAGHPFGDRCMKSAFAITKHRKESPVFLLFLDCVWQIWQQFPCSFEFNEDFLIMLAEHSFSSPYGTFICNNEKERKDNCLKTRTISLWSYVNRPEVMENFMNPMYDPNQAVTWPSVAPQSIDIWRNLYQRTQVNPYRVKEIWQEAYKVLEFDKELTNKAQKLRRQLASLEREAVASGIILPSESSDGGDGDSQINSALNST